MLRALALAERRCRVAAAFFAAALRWAVVRLRVVLVRRRVLLRRVFWVAIVDFASSPLVRGNSGLLVLMTIEVYRRTSVRKPSGL